MQMNDEHHGHGRPLCLLSALQFLFMPISFFMIGYEAT